MNADAILRVTVALRDRLKVALTRSQVPGTVFVGPLDDPDAGGAALVLFLYRIAPAANQRNSEHRVPSGKPQSAATALAAGVVEAVVAPDQLRAAALQILHDAISGQRDWRARRAISRSARPTVSS